MVDFGDVTLTPVDHDPWAGDRSFLLIRHGATKLNDQDNSVDRIRGWKDVPLSDKGKKEAEELGQSLKGTVLDAIYTSDLERARETAMIVANALGVNKLVVTKSLRPWNVGKLAGVKTTEALPIMAKYIREPTETVPDGESFDDFRERAFEGLKGILSEPDDKIAIVTHHRVERLIKGWKAAGYPPSGKVDLKTFEQKGESTGHAERIEVPLSALADAP